MTLTVPRLLASPNTWNGRHWRVKHRISQDWEHAIGAAMCDAMLAKGQPSGLDILGAFVGPRKWLGAVADRKMRVAVERQVPSGRNFIRDDDNLRFSVKPLLDALKRLGYIKNDSRNWLDLPTPTQSVSRDGKHYTVITIEPYQGDAIHAPGLFTATD